MLEQVSGHSDLITGVKFSPDGRSLYSIGGDGCIMIWDLAEDLVLAMQDRLLELYAAAQRKKQAVEEKAHSLAQVRTGPGGVLAEERGQADHSRRPATSAVDSTGSGEDPPAASSQGRPNTAHAPDRAGVGGKKIPASRLPAWAAREEGPGLQEVQGHGVKVAASVGGKWAARVDPAKLRADDRNKLTLEMTVEEATWHPPASPAAQSPANDRVANMESCDDVLIERDEDMTLLSGSSSDDEDVTGVAEGDSDGDDVLNKTSASLDRLEDAAGRLENWLENKVPAALWHGLQ